MKKSTGNKGKHNMSCTVQNAIAHWAYVAPLVMCPKKANDCKTLIAHLDELLNIVGNNEKHPLMSLVDTVSNAIASYESEQQKEPMGKGVDALRYLMQVHALRQSDLANIGSQGVVSEILQSKRKLNLRQVKKLAQYFKVSPETFID